MNIVYLIGNGFDKNLGMKTDYREFYEYYLHLPHRNDSDVVKMFKVQLDANLKYWSDLELALGCYLEFLDADQAVELHEHLIDHLSKYIEIEENDWPFDRDQKGLFNRYLMNPHKEGRLSEMETTAIDTYRSRWNIQAWDIKIITFNYSKSIERITQNQFGKIGNHGNYDIVLSAMEHIHGFTDERMILGVNDASQIANEKLRGESRVTNRYVKSDCNNNAYRRAHDAKCLQWISKANLICTFGLSFGDTDKKWWEAIGEALKRDCKMILFEYNPGKVFNKNQGPAQLDEEEQVKNKFLKQTNVEDSLIKKVKTNICVAYNTKMFKLDIGNRTSDGEGA